MPALCVCAFGNSCDHKTRTKQLTKEQLFMHIRSCYDLSTATNPNNSVIHDSMEELLRSLRYNIVLSPWI